MQGLKSGCVFFPIWLGLFFGRFLGFLEFFQERGGVYPKESSFKGLLNFGEQLLGNLECPLELSPFSFGYNAFFGEFFPQKGVHKVFGVK